MLRRNNVLKSCHMTSQFSLKHFHKVNLICIYGQKRKWTCGTILKPTGPVFYIVKLPDGMTWRHHQSQLKSCSEQITHPNQPPIHDSILTAPSTCQLSSLQTVPTRVSDTNTLSSK